MLNVDFKGEKDYTDNFFCGNDEVWNFVACR